MLDIWLVDWYWLVVDQFIIVDFLCCGYLFYFEFFGFDFDKYFNIVVWLGCISVLFGWNYFYDLMFGNFLDWVEKEDV